MIALKARTSAVVAGAAAALILLSGCSGQGQPAASGGKPVKIAFLDASAANTWLTASEKAMQAEAAKNNVDLVTFDAKFQPGAAAKQIQDVITTGQYKGIIIATIDGASVIPSLQDAANAGLKVVVLNQIVGTKLDTAAPQSSSIAASVLAPPAATGERLGKLTVQACEGTNPCSVVYLYGQKGTPYDNAVYQGFDSQISKVPGIKVIADGEGGFLGTDQPRKAVQDILQSHPQFNVLVGTGDQQVRGAQLALQDANVKDVKLIGVGGSEPAITGVKDGTWWGDVAGVPADEGQAALQAMLQALSGKNVGGIDATARLTDNGLITHANVDKFTAQWPG